MNGKNDTDGSAVPLRRGALWCPVIELTTGKIIGWPQGTAADIHYKVCDQGEYWPGNADGTKRAKWLGSYVPDSLLCVGDRGFGDYIIFKVSPDGTIVGWHPPAIAPSDWVPVPR